jgi:(1->4)-alpha-D-glucan 1-alpha-D-glucosylmutase
METPDWPDLIQNWRNGHLKLAWTRHLLKLRTELAGVFADGDYQPLAVEGPHRDHVIAFARRRGRDAVIIAVTKSLAAFSQGGRVWPQAESFEGTLRLDGYSVDGVNNTDLRLSELFRHLPVAALRAKFEGASKPARKRLHA